MEQRSQEEVERNRRNAFFYSVVGWATLTAIYLLLKGCLL